MMERKNSFLLFSGSSNKTLAKELASNLQTSLGRVRIGKFPDCETEIEILETVRGKDVFVLQSIARKPNEYLMELFIMIDALKRASAKSIQVIIPYYGYARQDRRHVNRVPITARLVANLLETAGATRLMTMDLHTDQIQGFFTIPTDNLSAQEVLLAALQKESLVDVTVVSPDIGSNKMAMRYAKALNGEIALVHKVRINGKNVSDGGLLGNVFGKNVVIVDDICATYETLRLAASVCQKHGAKRIVGLVTHAVLPRAKKIPGVERLFVTNSIPAENVEKDVEMVSIAPLLAKAILRTLSGESVSSLSP
ncbi:MAG: ribose-phosphate diphosphokinase [Chlamydiota bacterium]